MSDETSTPSERPALLEADSAASAAAPAVAPRQEEQPAQQPAEEMRKDEAPVEQRPSTRPHGSGAAVWIALLIAVAALAMAGWQWWESQQRAGKLQDELARRLSAGDSVSKESLVVSHQVQESLAALQGKVASLDARMTESQGQQAALEAMYQELSRGGDERVLAEIEQAVTWLPNSCCWRAMSPPRWSRCKAPMPASPAPNRGRWWVCARPWAAISSV